MRVKTFEANSMQDALNVVKREMGEEAFILSTKSKVRRTAQGEETIIEVTAAVDEAGMPAAVPATGTYGLRPPLAARTPEPISTPLPKLPVNRVELASTPPPPPVDLQPLRRELLEIKGAVEALREQETRNATILKELDQLKTLLSRIQKQGMPPAQLQLPQALL